MSLQQASDDYQRIAEAIAFLRAHYREQPSLSGLASRFGLSEAYFQRLFSRWAGISPKRFVQFLTVEYAKQRMLQSHALLDLSLQAGLSGPGRLHDLFVVMEAMSPGEYKRRAAQLSIRYGLVPTPFGPALLGFTERGICHLSFVDEPVDAHEHLRQSWPAACLQQDAAAARKLGEQLFGAAQPRQPLCAWVVGSNFQVQVWRALLRLPFGHLLSYRQVAEQVGRPGAARAVGTAMARNPIGFVIPCHRVLRESGEFGVYHWGRERKAAMVAWEAAQLRQQRHQRE